ncbi:MAG TPA: hypothetical protein EYP22_01840 [Methanosarcinales archaeon]|nr:hypothetical protein [Methanosarcinales archaeon]
MLEALVRGEETRLQQEKLRQQNVIEQLRLLEDMRRQQALEEYWARQLSPKEIEKRQKARLKAAEEFEEESEKFSNLMNLYFFLELFLRMTIYSSEPRK